MFFENPNEEVYFGEVYRQILQESWAPSGSEYWDRLGLSRRGRRPTQRGITSPNLTPSQETVRRWFSSCAASFRALPWDTPSDKVCDGRWGRDYWFNLKTEKGVMCSYYDLYMRYCISFALATGCIPPANYFLNLEAGLSSVFCDTYYPISCINKCGDLSLYDSPGSYSPETGWILENCCGYSLEIFAAKNTLSPGETTTLWVEDPQPPGAGQLKFKDSQGALGCIEFSMNPAAMCVYNWEIVSGGGSLDAVTGISVHYTAPAIQPGCEDKPYIRCYTTDLSAYITIGVNSWTGDEPAFGIYKYANPCADPAVTCYEGVGWDIHTPAIIRYKCDGSFLDEIRLGVSIGCWGSDCCCPKDCDGRSMGSACIDMYVANDGLNGYYWGQYNDLRTEDMIDGGCCPAEV